MYKRSSGFTIVELLIVVVVIAILAAITIVAYNGVSDRAKKSAAQSALTTASKKVYTYMTVNGEQAPASLSEVGIVDSDSTKFQYSRNTSGIPHTFCITTFVGTARFYLNSVANSSPSEGVCPGHIDLTLPIADGSLMQSITAANCPTSRTRAVDARDSRSYWVQKMGDNKCWMLTNLAYAGGGANTHGDVRSLVNGSGQGASYTTPYYYAPTAANPTTEPTSPSTSTNGGSTAPQYGYLYNWCGATGAQTTTSGCNSTDTTPPSVSISVCPSGWRLPTGGEASEFVALNSTVNSGATNSDAGLRSTWLSQRGGYWNNGFLGTGADSHYWAGTMYDATLARKFFFQSSSVYPVDAGSKIQGFAVRCVAN